MRYTIFGDSTEFEGLAVRSLIALIFSFFFRGQRQFFSKYVGLDAEARFSNHIPLDEIFKAEQSNNLFIKLDIEGSEYRCLEHILAIEHRVNGLVIEFHDCDVHLAIIEEFVRRTNLRVVHVHANNYAPIRKSDQLPLVLEVTFSRGLEGGTQATEKKLPLDLPHDLDMPNNPREPEIQLLFDVTKNQRPT